MANGIALCDCAVNDSNAARHLPGCAITAAQFARYFASRAYAAANRGYETSSGAEAARKLQPHPGNWYVWQMNDGRWHTSLMTNRER